MKCSVSVLIMLRKMIKKVMKIRNWRGYPQVNIPKEILAMSGLRIGDYVWVEAGYEKIIISKVGGESGDKSRTNPNREDRRA